MNTTARHPRRTLRIAAVTLILCAFGMSLEAQNRQNRQRLKINPIERHLYAPELVMNHQDELGLSEQQRQTLIEEVQALQSDMVPLQFELGQAVEDLDGLVKTTPVDEAAAVSLIERVTGLEGQIKRRHLVLLIRIKNLLDAEQRNTLRQLRVQQRRPRALRQGG
ncbi:MAG: periplasmic heavy metal sensor [Acidobacteriota bacterium]